MSHHLLIGALVGLVAVVLFMVPELMAGRTITLAYHLGDALKVVGGIVGGFIAASRARTAASGGNARV